MLVNTHPASLPAPVATYLAQTFARIDRMLAHLRFVEPVTCEVARPLEPVIDAIVAHTTTRVIGSATEGLHHVLGARVSTPFREATRTAVAAARADARATLVLVVPPSTDLASEVRSRLRARMRVAAAELREVFAAAAPVMAGEAPDIVACIFNELADDMLVSRHVIDHVLACWRVHVAALEGQPTAKATVVLRTASPRVPSPRPS